MQTFKRKKIFSVKQAIQDQANRDSEWYNYMTPTPVYVKPKVIKNNAGWYNFILQLRP